MIKFFSEEWRGIGVNEKQRGIIFSFDFRKKLHLFNGAKLHVLMAVILHTNERGICWPSYDLLVKETGYTRSTIAIAIKELCEMEIDGCKIMVKWRERDEGGKFIKGNYYLVFPTQEELDSQSMIFPTVEKSNVGKIILEDNTDIKEKDILKDNLSPTDLPDEKYLPKEEKKPTDHQLMTTTLAEVMNIDTDIIDIWKRYGRFASALLKKYTPEQIKCWYGSGGWWYLHHDFGKDGQYPSEGLIKTTIKTASEFTEQKTELTPEVEELENHFESLTGFFVLPYGVRRENDWIKPCQALLSRTADLLAAKKLMSDALQFAREEKYIVKAPSSLLTIALNMNGSGSEGSESGAHAIDDEIGGCYV